MNRIIINNRNITPDLINAVNELYPYGCSEEDMIVFRNAKNEIVKAVEVTLNDTDYLIKISKQLIVHLDNLDDEIEEIDITDDLQTALD